MSSLIYSNPAGSVPPYKDLYTTVVTVPPNTALAFVSTQWAGDADSNVLFPNDYRKQAKYIWENLAKMLKDMGCGLKDVVLKKLTVVDFNDDIGKETTEAFIECFPDEKEYLFKSGVEFARAPGFHKPGIVISIGLIVVVPAK